MSKKKTIIKNGETLSYKRESYRGHWKFVFRDINGHVVERQNWHVGEYSESTAPSAPKISVPAEIPSASRANNMMFDELVFYGVDEDNNHQYFLEVRLSNVVLPMHVSPDELIPSVMPALQRLQHGKMINIKVGAHGGHLTDMPVSHNVRAASIKKVCGGKAKDKEWFHDESNINV
jgi:hypothetical protein